jgi:LmbE family N-acetylglucosaminyl deacetylase
VVAPGARAYAKLVLRARRWTQREASAKGPWLIVAPHPDDESLGTGSLIASVAQAGGRAFVAFLTDGVGSHPEAPGWSAARVGRTRAAEARGAMRQLGVSHPPLHLGWPDADPHPRDSDAFARSVGALAAWCRRRGVRSIAVTWRDEPHCDHEAAAELAAAVAHRLHADLYEYLVWGWTLPDVDLRLRDRRIVAIDVTRGRPRQRRAIACHRSQTGTRIAGARDAFRLPRTMLALADRPRLVLLPRSASHAS